jgi:two-component system cell cycle response regulator DivK
MRPWKVLIIEDNEDNLRLERMLLGPLGVEITEARDGLHGVETAQGGRFDLILLDIQLPVMDGYQVARALRRIPHCASVPIVAVTSYAMAGDRERSLESGCSGYLEKPLDPSLFASQVEAFLSSGARE